MRIPGDRVGTFNARQTIAVLRTQKQSSTPSSLQSSRQKRHRHSLLTSTCSQILYLSQMSAICGIGSQAPYTVVPAVAHTKKGCKPDIRQSSLVSYQYCTISLTLSFAFHDFCFQRFWDHFAHSISGDVEAVVSSDAQHCCCTFDRIMALKKNQAIRK